MGNTSRVMQKVQNFKNKRPGRSGGSRQHTRGIFKNWGEGENFVRLVDEFLHVETHFIAPVPNRSDRGLCMSEAFARDADPALPKVINCPDWNLDAEEDNEEKTCPICMLHEIAQEALENPSSDDEKKFFENLAASARRRTAVKWNIFDRDFPNVTVVDENGTETQQKGLKIATVTMEAYRDIEGIFQQTGFDITDPDNGIDIKVIKGHNGHRTEYSAQAVLEGTGLKVTPFDEEEQKIIENLPDLKAICGKQTDVDAVYESLHGDLRELVDAHDKGTQTETSEVADDDSAKEAAAVADDDSGDDDDDGLELDSKKK